MRERAITIRSADPAVRWRIATGVVQRSTDGGSTWQSQDAGVTFQLVAGASSSSTVCWIVGRRGTILLSTDGQSWRHVVFPEAVDLASVRASSGESATVTTADGRVFSTDDGGVTWTPN